MWGVSIEALDLIRSRIERFGIDCDWQDGYLGVAVSGKKARELREWRDRIASVYDYPLEWFERDDVSKWIASPRYVAGLHDARSGHLHPLKYSLGLARAAASLGVQIHEHSPVAALERGERAGAACTVRTARGSVVADQVLLAGNVYLPEFGPGIASGLDARIMPVGTYIVCSEPLGEQRCRALIPSRSAVCASSSAYRSASG